MEIFCKYVGCEFVIGYENEIMMDKYLLDEWVIFCLCKLKLFGYGKFKYLGENIIVLVLFKNKIDRLMMVLVGGFYYVVDYFLD